MWCVAYHECHVDPHRASVSQDPVPLGNAVLLEVERRTDQQAQVAVARTEQNLCSAPRAAPVVPLKDDTADRIRECQHALLHDRALLTYPL